MKEHPILFSTEMVKAILYGRKMQTRRVIKPQPFFTEKLWFYKHGCMSYALPNQGALDDRLLGIWDKGVCPYGQVGDRLWVRESLQVYYTGTPIRYYADGCPVMRDGESLDLSSWTYRYSVLPSIFMPRWASRITLEITDIRVQRLQEISWADCIFEGISETITGQARKDYEYLWDSINGKKYPWETNSWVWAISFKEIK